MSIWHLLILAVVVLLVLGTGKLSKVGPDLGSAIREFKKNLHGDDNAITHKEGQLLRADDQPSGSNGAE